MSAIAADVTSGSATPVAQQKSDGTITGQVLDQNGAQIGLHWAQDLVVIIHA